MLDFKESRYNLHLPLTNGDYLVYNTLYGSAVVLTNDEDNRLRNISTSDFTEETLRGLTDNRIIVQSELDELQIIKDTRRRAIKQSKVFDLILLSSMACNFSCFYCYEKKTIGDMTPEICEAVIKFLGRISKQYELIRICWFGGEPLMNPAAIIEIGNYIHQLSKNSDCLFETNITTNGYLLTPELIDRLVPLGIDKFMITIDGIKSTHDQYRPLRGGGPTYKKIVDNIKHLITCPIKLTLRMNFNKGNAVDITPLLEEFDSKYRQKITILLEPIFGDDSINATGSMSSEEILDYMSSMYRLATEMGYQTSSGDISINARKSTYCYAERESQIIVSPTGNIFKCPVHHLGNSKPQGTISPSGTIRYNREYKKWMSYGNDIPNCCKQCKCLPICMCSCRVTVQKTLFEGKKNCALEEVVINRILKYFTNNGFTINTSDARRLPL